MSFSDRYASSINSSNLKNAEVKGYEGQSTLDTSVLGAMGMADRALTEGRVVTGPDKSYPIKPSPLAGAIARLLMGDDRATSELLSILGQVTFERSWDLKVKVTRVQADDIAKACYAWYRHGTCKPCGGHGKTLIPGTKTHSERDCEPCKGSGRMPFEPQFRPEHRELARWTLAELSRSAGRAFDVAARKIAPTLDL